MNGDHSIVGKTTRRFDEGSSHDLADYLRAVKHLVTVQSL
jgi:hypothetical protein